MPVRTAAVSVAPNNDGEIMPHASNAEAVAKTVMSGRCKTKRIERLHNRKR